MIFQGIGVIAIFLFSNLIGLVSCQQSGTIIPLYIYPENGTEWNALLTAKASHSNVPVWAIVNVNSGPGEARNSDFTDGIRKLVNAGINVMGYVYTLYGKRSATVVKSEIDSWINFYGGSITGIFFDEMAYENATAEQREAPAYYRNLTAYAKSKGVTFTVGNPGTDTKINYVDTVDTIVIYETDKGFPQKSQYEGWHKNYPRTKWAILPYNVPLEVSKVREAKPSVQWIFVTDDKLPNPWDTLPGYLDQLFATLE